MNIDAFLFDKKFWIVRHALFWIVMYLDEFLSIFGLTEPIGWSWTFFLGLLLDVAMVYFNLYYVIPRFFQRSKMPTYVGLTLLTLMANVAILTIVSYPPCEDCSLFSDIFSTTLFTSGLLGIAIAIKVSKISYLRQQRLNDLQQLQLNTELNYLKKQVNPHFLFNVLNNMYVQSRESPKEVPETIMKLSELMRYQTYDAAKEQVSLKQEVNFIEKYLDLEKMRREFLHIDVKKEGDFNNVAVPPMLFLPFVENACKHSTLTTSEAEHIRIKWEHKAAKLVFTIENTIGNRRGHINDDQYSGFGLENIKKRIELLYPDKHELSIKEENGLYKVKLVLVIS